MTEWTSIKKLPDESGQYLTRRTQEGFMPIYEVRRWSAMLQKWTGLSALGNVTHWCRIEEPEEVKNDLRN